jgi:hypothetical protein
MAAYGAAPRLPPIPAPPPDRGTRVRAPAARRRLAQEKGLDLAESKPKTARKSSTKPCSRPTSNRGAKAQPQRAGPPACLPYSQAPPSMKTALVTGAPKHRPRDRDRAGARRLPRRRPLPVLSGRGRSHGRRHPRAGGSARSFRGPRDPAQVDALVQAVDRQLGPLHTLVSNAGILKGNLMPSPSGGVARGDDGQPGRGLLATRRPPASLARQKAGRIIYISSEARCSAT